LYGAPDPPMCNDCLTKGLWAHEETEQLDKFISGFTKKKPAKRGDNAQWLF
jgi:hypothetical protein